ncbi:hypothetical protein LF1_12740 [Rubripirellula obstinata]|uniref:Uncharacterized protein n=1 Tax=Rubripirellula obstinata TaxID=406547 RepID=A0A5B1CEU5_9BACT|nr:hypothetical protein [Rubripirellula obstinata]KAA1258751.1 hypothetical protein LF1_12740 [Rubripirellula obstinata]
MKFVIIGVFVVILIAFFYLVWKAAQNWRWYQIVPVCILMILAMLFTVPTAGVLKSRASWHKKKEELELQAAQLKSENRVLKYGDATSGKGLTDLSRQVAKLGIEAGRSWRGLRMTNGDSQSVILNVVPDEAVIPVAPVEGEEPLPTLPLIPEGLVVYGLAEAINPQTQMAVPTFYLGEFKVTASTATQITLAPTTPLEEAQKQAIDSGKARQWSVYELLPLDGHSPFIAEGSAPSDENWLGRVDEELVKRLLGKRVDADTLQSYLDDGRRATADDPPLSRWIKVEFLKNHTENVDSTDQRGALDGGFFDGSGRAVDARLQRADGKPATFRKGDTILIQEIGSDEWIDEGIVKLLDRYYLRPLNDYRFILRHIRLRLSELANRTDELNEQKGQLDEAIDKSNGMLVANTEIKVKLEQDLNQFKIETAAIRQYTQEMADSLATMKKEMARLHKQNIALEMRLGQLHRSLDAGAGVGNLTMAVQ